MRGSARRLLRHRAGFVGAAIVALLLAFAIFGPVLASHDPYASDFVRGVGEGGGPVGPSSEFWLGADRIFRDELARLAWGARSSLAIGLAATAIATSIGALVGVVAGYYEGTGGVRVPWSLVLGALGALALVIAGHASLGQTALATGALFAVAGHGFSIEPLRAGPRVNADVALMRLVDVGLSFPFLLLVMAIGAALDRTTATTVTLVLGVTGWLGAARIVRTKTLQIRAHDYVIAARALGRSTAGILARHVLPNVASTLLIVATASVAQMIVAESVLGYLGVGVGPPAPTWGRMLFEGQDYYLAAPWLVLAPGLAIVLAVLGFNLLGEGLRDALEPREG